MVAKCLSFDNGWGIWPFVMNVREKIQQAFEITKGLSLWVGGGRWMIRFMPGQRLVLLNIQIVELRNQTKLKA